MGVARNGAQIGLGHDGSAVGAAFNGAVVWDGGGEAESIIMTAGFSPVDSFYGGYSTGFTNPPQQAYGALVPDDYQGNTIIDIQFVSIPVVGDAIGLTFDIPVLPTLAQFMRVNGPSMDYTLLMNDDSYTTNPQGKGQFSSNTSVGRNDLVNGADYAITIGDVEGTYTHLMVPDRTGGIFDRVGWTSAITNPQDTEVGQVFPKTFNSIIVASINQYVQDTSELVIEFGQSNLPLDWFSTITIKGVFQEEITLSTTDGLTYLGPAAPTYTTWNFPQVGVNPLVIGQLYEITFT